MYFAVARRVADRPHTLSGDHVNVKLHRRHEKSGSRRDRDNGKLPHDI